MDFTIVHLSDIHIRTATDKVLSRSSLIARACLNRLSDGCSHVVILISGDLTYSGSKDEFALADAFLENLRKLFEESGRLVTFVIIPGNHDCYLAGDQQARDSLIQDGPLKTLTSQSIRDVVHAPLSNYIAFAQKLVGDQQPLHKDSFYYGLQRLVISSLKIDFHLFNSAWMSRRHETPGSLSFPLTEVRSPPDDEPDYSFSVIHHPIENWFKQPDVMRPLRDRVESISDAILTGHEHVQRWSSQSTIDVNSVTHRIEGGVLQASGSDDTSEFCLIGMDLTRQRLVRTTFSFNSEQGAYCEEATRESSAARNPGRAASPHRLRDEFLCALDDPGLPITHSRTDRLRLSDYFTFPDLREYSALSDDANWKHVKGDQFVETAMSTHLFLVAGAAKVGKTSCAKRLTFQLHRSGILPVFVDGASLSKLTDSSEVRKFIRKRVSDQYEILLGDSYEAMPRGKKALVIDNCEHLLRSQRSRQSMLRVASEDYEHTVLFCDIDVCVELTRDALLGEPLLSNARRFEICELGMAKIRHLATQWVSIGQVMDGDVLTNRIDQVVSLLESVLKENAIPHHPWIIIVLLQQADSNQEIAVKNGSYGHLFQSILTFALTSIGSASYDVQTVFGYLGGLAYEMHGRRESTLDRALLRDFHLRYCGAKLISIDIDRMLRDLVKSGIVRDDGGLFSFRSGFTYCFFVAWHFSRNLHRTEVEQGVRETVRRLYETNSANIIVFLAHLSNDPLILECLEDAAADLLKSQQAASLDSDVNKINSLQADSIAIEASTATLREGLDAREAWVDAGIVNRTPDTDDGRNVYSREKDACHHDDPSAQEITEVLSVESAMQTIRILGQIVRNNAGTSDGDDKVLIIKEVYCLAARVLGLFLSSPTESLVDIAARLIDQRVESNDAEPVAIARKKVAEHIFGVLWFGTFCLCRRLAESVSHELLRPCYSEVLKQLGNTVTFRIFDFAVDLQQALDSPPIAKAEDLYRAVESNRFSEMLVRALVVDYMYLYNVDYRVKQRLCQKLSIKLPARVFDTSRKRSMKRITGSTDD